MLSLGAELPAGPLHLRNMSDQSTGIRHFLQSSFRRASVADFHFFFVQSGEDLELEP